ncbi:hypothetical protein YC2023_074943 [Brassica napus]
MKEEATPASMSSTGVGRQRELEASITVLYFLLAKTKLNFLYQPGRPVSV